jgi:hypothetical protein
MAQTGYTPILIYSSSTASAAPVAGNLTNSTLGSELAINITDGKLFYKDNANAVQVIGWKTVPTSAGGTGLTSYTAGDLLYYATGTALTKLAIGATDTVLTSSGSAPQWSSALTITGLTNSGNLTFTGTGNRITGDFSNATLANRVAFQTSTTNGATTVNVIPNGTGSVSSVQANNSSDPANGSQIYIAAGASVTQIAADKSGTGTYLPMAFYTGGSEDMRLHVSGGVSIGDTTDPGTGNLRLGTGNLVIGTSGKGIDFSATAGTGTSELLDDYEEGTWTPTIASNTGTITSYTSSGSYTKVGRQVTLIFTFKITNNGTGAGFIKITNLPFNVVTGNSAGTGVEFSAVGYQTAAYVASSTQINMFKYDWTYPGGLNHDFRVTITYQN